MVIASRNFVLSCMEPKETGGVQAVLSWRLVRPTSDVRGLSNALTTVAEQVPNSCSENGVKQGRHETKPRRYPAVSV